MRIDVLTLFPQMFQAPFSFGIFKRAIDNGLVSLNLHNIRDYAHDKHHTADDYPYGGGAGMVMLPGPVYEAVEAIKAGVEKPDELPVILLSPQGRLFTQEVALELSRQPPLLQCPLKTIQEALKVLPEIECRMGDEPGVIVDEGKKERLTHRALNLDLRPMHTV